MFADTLESVQVVFMHTLMQDKFFNSQLQRNSLGDTAFVV
jgi:hypothetical protein